jgi:hypothetical protein
MELILLEKPTVAQPFKKFPALYGKRRLLMYAEELTTNLCPQSDECGSYPIPLL